MTLAAQPSTDHDERLLAVLAPWLPGRRWFPAKGATASLTLVGVLPLSDDVRVLLVRARAGSIDALLQVPLVLGPGSGELIGTTEGIEVHEAASDPRCLRAGLAAADGPGTEADPDHARVISGEQSNTSVILGDVAILKVLRALQAGENPDVDVPRRLVEQGWAHVPAPLAWLEGEWVDPEGTPRRGYLGAMSTFVRGAQDGFELACDLASRQESFAELAPKPSAVPTTMH
jgi:maltokinase